MLKFELNVAERKTLAKRMEDLTGIHPYYTKAPLYSYDIGNYTIDRDGNLLVEPENADAELLTTLLNEGLIRGGESIEDADAQNQPENTELTVDEEPVTEAEAEEVEAEEAEQQTDAEQEILDEQEADDVDTTEPEESSETEAGEAQESDDMAADGTAEDAPEEEPENEEPQEAEDQTDEVPLDLELSFPVSQHNGVTLRNLVNLLYSRGKLIGKATGGHFHVDEGLVEKLKDDSCTFAIMNFINAVSNYEAEHGVALEGLRITTEKVTFTGFPTAPDHDHLPRSRKLSASLRKRSKTRFPLMPRPERVHTKKAGWRPSNLNPARAFRWWCIPRTAISWHICWKKAMPNVVVAGWLQDPTLLRQNRLVSSCSNPSSKRH